MDNDHSRRPPPAPPVTGSYSITDEPEDALEYDTTTDSYRVTFDSTTESLCLAIVSTVAAVSATDPEGFEPLQSVVDVDALNALMKPATSAPAPNDVHVTFTLNDCEVTVHSYGIIAVHPPDEHGTQKRD